MKVLIVGAGAVGSVISQHLSGDPDVSEVVCASKDLERAKEFIQTGNKKTKLLLLDASDPQKVVGAAKGANLIINASLPRFNEIIMGAALQVGANYQDLASELADLRTAEQLNFHERFRRAGLVALINTGVAPGITNLLAREAVDKFDSDQADEIHFRLVEEQKASEFILAWSAETALDDLTSPPLIFKNGKFSLTKPFADPEEYEFPHPFGKRHVFSIYGDEVATVPLFIKVNNVDFKSSGADIEFSKALFRLGLFDKRPITLNGKKIIPLEFFKKIAPKVPPPKKIKQLIQDGIIEDASLFLIVEAVGKGEGQRIKVKISATFPNLKEMQRELPGSTYISNPTGTAAYAFSKIIPKMKSAGVFPPETLGKEMRKNVLITLEGHNIIINQQFEGL